MAEYERSKQRNLNIDLMKFLYSWIIVFYHFYSSTKLHFVSGRYAVEFYLLAAGVFFFQAWERSENEPPQKYIYKRFMRFLPWSTTAFIFTFVVGRVITAANTPRQLIYYLFTRDIWEVLLISMNGITKGKAPLNGPAWTMSAMLLVEIVLLGCLYCNKKAVINVVIPASLITGFGFWCNTSSIAVMSWVGFTTFGVLRAWLNYGCAYYCLKLSGYLRDVDFNMLGRLVLTIIETLCHCFAVLAILYTESRHWHLCMLLALMIALSIALSGHSLWGGMLEKISGPVKYLGAFSLSIYLMHRPISRYFEYIYPKNSELYAHVAPYVAAVLAGSLAHYLITTGLIRFWRLHGMKIKAAFLKNGPD